MKIIIEDQLKEASNQIISDETDSNEVLTHLSDSLATGNNFFKFSISRKKPFFKNLHILFTFFPGEEDIVFAQSKIKSRTTSLSKEAVRYEVGWMDFENSFFFLLIIFLGILVPSINGSERLKVNK